MRDCGPDVLLYVTSMHDVVGVLSNARNMVIDSSQTHCFCFSVSTVTFGYI